MAFNIEKQYIGDDKLADFAGSLSDGIASPGKVCSRGLAVKAISALGAVKAAAGRTAKEAAKAAQASGWTEWLLDNWYVAEREGREAAKCLDSNVKLPEVKGREKTSVLEELARLLVESGCGRVSDARLVTFTNAFQEKRPLSQSEIALLIPAVKAELVIYLSEVCENTDDEDGGKARKMENVFTSLRFLGGFDSTQLLESINVLERILSEDPDGTYCRMDEESRHSYRSEVSRLAKKYKMSETDAAGRILELAQRDNCHIGIYIFKKPLGCEKRSKSGIGYIGTIVIISIFLALWLGFLLENAFVAALLVFPVSEVVKNITDYVVVKAVHPKRIPRLELKDGIPRESRTLCVISALLSRAESSGKFIDLIEEYRLANRDAGGELLFGILADLPEADSETTPADREIISAAAAGVDRLNAKYGGGFYFLCRRRKKCASSGRYMGWERKRGAILELVRMMRGEETSLSCYSGDKLGLEGVKYLITLDSDTRLCVGTARELVGAMTHPLNAPVVDSAAGIVRSGCGLIQPRISVDLDAANRSDFTKIFAGQGGIDPYGSATSDVYQDLFEKGSYTGKGIIDADAYYKCLNGRIPENSVLSHDLLEGIYLNCAFMGDTELTDGYPYKVTSYFERLHRWTRGDWQIIGWLGGKVRDASGGRKANAVDDIGKWKIFDNLRRSLVPVFTFAALLFGMLFSRLDFAWAAALAVLSVMSNMLISSADMMFRRGTDTRVKYHSTIISGFAGWFMQTFIRLMFLPHEAWVGFSAAVTAIFRMAVTKKGLLAWVTAADSEFLAKNSLAANYNKMWPCAVWGVLVMLLTPYASAAAVGLVWLLTPAYAMALSREIKVENDLSQRDRRYLARLSGDIWKYFEENMTAGDNFLPPDNIQIRPDTGAAHRTSPTNIGLAMLSSVAAFDLGAATKQKATGAVENILAAVERLPKWRGHLFNWYDTETLRVLRPEYVSTVDSGNFIGCLIAVKEAMIEMGEQKLAEKCENLMRNTDFSQLYDDNRKLFYIGFDASKGEPTKGWYDLLESEARQTSYIAVARGDVPRKHWRRLGRALVSKDGYRGMASWTGTMFEYLMPGLLLPCYRNSLLFESSRFCIYVQKRTASHGIWGMSESGFYSFDAAMNYMYKAHGAQRLALKRKMGIDKVISPYSAFLALAVDPKSAIKDLKAMQKLGLEGKYGLYESVDFTPDRQTDGEYQVVRSYMAHHLGMSIISADNAVNGGIMQKRFMRNVEMAAFKELLQEKVPVGQVVLRQLPADVPEKPCRAGSSIWERRTDKPNLLRPKCAILSNEAVSILVTDCGQNSVLWRGRELVRFDRELCGENNGLSFYFESDGEVFSLQPDVKYCRDSSFSAYFSGEKVSLKSVSGSLESEISYFVPQGELGVKIKVFLRQNGNAVVKGRLICCFEPVIQKRADFTSHPSFSKLSLMAESLPHSILIKRREKGSEGEAYLCFAGDRPMGFVTSKHEIFGRGNRVIPGKASASPAIFGPRAEPDMFVCGAVDIILRPDAGDTVTFALSPGDSAGSSSGAANGILKSGESGALPRLDGIGKELGMSPVDIDRAMAGLSELVFMTGSGSCADIPVDVRGALWAVGISGDIPIASVEVKSADDIEPALRAVREHALLRACGFEYDLAVILADGNDYRSPVKTALNDSMRMLGCGRQINSSGGVHFVDASAPGAPAVIASSCRICGAAPKQGPELKAKCASSKPAGEKEEGYIGWRQNSDGSISFDMDKTLPYPAWSSVLANETFGFIASDAGTGHMWHLNSRENKINNWKNDFRTSEGTERLEISVSGGVFSLFAADDGCRCRVTFGFGYAVWEKVIGEIKTRVTSFVVPAKAERITVIETEGTGPEDKIRYYTELVMGTGSFIPALIETGISGGVLTAKSMENTEFPDEVFKMGASGGIGSFTCKKTSYLAGVFDGRTGCGRDACFAVEFEAKNRLILVHGMESGEVINFDAHSGPDAALEETKRYWKERVGTVSVKTGNPYFDSYVSGWALYQVIACRMFARASLYQCGGAFGFRDQLQDACALMLSCPETARRQIVLSAGHQYEEGDVQHWWHPVKAAPEGAGDKGVRTRCSDDFLWLPYTLCEYVAQTGDKSVCIEKAGFISSPPLGTGEKERYEQPAKSSMASSVFEHAAKACELLLSRGVGSHGLCFFGTGDWNDGMNAAGENGVGESVWLTWFASLVLKRFGGLCRTLGRVAEAARYEAEARRLFSAADRAWDGNWYLRGYFDDGTPIGAASCENCRIDSIAQSFSVLSGGSSGKTETALENAYNMLFDKKESVVRLFDPPFDGKGPDPGYIKGYCPGFRENGGQYTHGAVWLGAAMLAAKHPEEGWEILRALLPGGHNRKKYGAEPFVLAADVYYNPSHRGRGGWSWYTGAAGWYFRTAVGDMLGLKLRDGRLFIEPCLPKELDSYEASVRTPEGGYLIKVSPDGRITVNGEEYSAAGYPAYGDNFYKLLIQNQSDM